MSLFRHTCVRLHAHAALAIHGLAASKFRRVDQLLRVGPTIPGSAAHVFLRVARFESVGHDPSLQCTGFELVQNPAPDLSLQYEWVPLTAVASIIHMHHLCVFQHDLPVANQHFPHCTFSRNGKRKGTAHHQTINRFILNPFL